MYGNCFAPLYTMVSDKGTLGDVKFKKIKFLQKIKVYIVWMTTALFFIGGG